MTILATIGAKALYLLFLWLVSAAAAAWLADRKGYTERVGLTFGLVLTFVGLLIVLLLPPRPGSAWKLDGPIPRRRGRPGGGPAVATGPPPAAGQSPPAAGQSPPPAGQSPPGAGQSPPGAGQRPPAASPGEPDGRDSPDSPAG